MPEKLLLKNRLLFDLCHEIYVLVIAVIHLTWSSLEFLKSQSTITRIVQGSPDIISIRSTLYFSYLQKMICPPHQYQFSFRTVIAITFTLNVKLFTWDIIILQGTTPTITTVSSCLSIYGKSRRTSSTVRTREVCLTLLLFLYFCGLTHFLTKKKLNK